MFCLIRLNFFRRQVEESRKEAEKDGVVVPTTVSEYCIKTRIPSKDSTVSNDISEIFFDDDDDDYGVNGDYDDFDDDDDDENEDYGDDDSGAHDEA